MVLLTSIVTVTAALWVIPKITDGENGRPLLRLACSSSRWPARSGAFASTGPLFLLRVSHELALIPTFLLIGIWGLGDRQAIAWKAYYHLSSGLGSFILLIGLIGLYLTIARTAGNTALSTSRRSRPWPPPGSFPRATPTPSTFSSSSASESWCRSSPSTRGRRRRTRRPPPRSQCSILAC